MEKDGGRGSTGADRRRNAGKGGGERRGGEGKSERKRTRMVAAGRQMTADRRKTHPNCSTVSLSRLFLRMSPPPFAYIFFTWLGHERTTYQQNIRGSGDACHRRAFLTSILIPAMPRMLARHRSASVLFIGHSWNPLPSQRVSGGGN